MTSYQFSYNFFSSEFLILIIFQYCPQLALIRVMHSIWASQAEAGSFKQKLMLSSSFRCYQIHNCHRNDFGHTLLCYLSWTDVFNKSTSCLLNKGSCLSTTLSVTKFINMRYLILVILFVILKSHLDVQQTHRHLDYRLLKLLISSVSSHSRKRRKEGYFVLR